MTKPLYKDKQEIQGVTEKIKQQCILNQQGFFPVRCILPESASITFKEK